jgi:PAS domain S-box-containing protein
MNILNEKHDSTGKREGNEPTEILNNYRSLIDLTPDIIYRLREDGTILFISPAVQQLGYDPEELIGRPFEEIICPEDRQKSRDHFVERRIGERRTKNLEVRLLNKQQGAFYYELKYTYLTLSARGQWDVPDDAIKDPEKHFLYTQGIARDITERKHLEAERQKLEERLHRSEKMEALGTLAGGVAHDLNNVLGVLVGYSELMLESIPDGNPLRKYANAILKSSEKGASIVQDLLTLARRNVPVLEVLDLNSVIANFMKTPVFEKLQRYHPLVTFNTVPESNLLNLEGSPIHLEKTVMNLISNASEAISGRGEVTIKTENRYVDKSIQGYDHVRAGDYVVLSISDNGEGIAPANLDKIFEPFFTKKTMGRSGTGLGLMVVWGTVKDHKGYIDVHSEEGRGSTFTLYFPVTRQRLSEPVPKTAVEHYLGRGEAILVVDDTLEQQEVAASMLTRLGYQVQTVSSGEEAVDYLKTHEVDLLVLDMIMEPGIDGLETYRQVRAIRPGQKAIIVSGYSESDRATKARELGTGAYIQKPYILEKIGMAIRDELRQVA